MAFPVFGFVMSQAKWIQFKISARAVDLWSAFELFACEADRGAFVAGDTVLVLAQQGKVFPPKEFLLITKVHSMQGRLWSRCGWVL
eukprot:4282543-Amphidinium_carterae.1